MDNTANKNVSLVLAYIHQVLANEPFDVHKVSGRDDFLGGGVRISLKFHVSGEAVEEISQRVGATAQPIMQQMVAAHESINGVQALDPEETDSLINQMVRESSLTVDPTQAFEDVLQEVTESAEAVYGGSFVTEVDASNVTLTRDDGAVTVETTKDELALELNDHQLQSVPVQSAQTKERTSRKKRQIVEEITEAMQVAPKPVQAEKQIATPLALEDQIAEALELFGDN